MDKKPQKRDNLISKNSCNELAESTILSAVPGQKRDKN